MYFWIWGIQFTEAEKYNSPKQRNLVDKSRQIRKAVSATLMYRQGRLLQQRGIQRSPSLGFPWMLVDQKGTSKIKKSNFQKQRNTIYRSNKIWFINIERYMKSFKCHINVPDKADCWCKEAFRDKSVLMMLDPRRALFKLKIYILEKQRHTIQT